MADLRTRIVQAMRPHADLGNRCLCGQKWPTGCRFDVEQYDLHVADAVIRELEADFILVPKSHTLAQGWPRRKDDHND